MALTLDGQVLGTPAYMSPEQADGRISEIDERSDIYSLGAILYEILTFHPPFEGRNALEVLTMVRTGTIAPPSSRIASLRAAGGPSPGAACTQPDGVPPELDEVVLRALSKSKAGRYSSARQLAEEIQLFLEGEKQREYNHRAATAKIEQGRRLAEQNRSLRRESLSVDAELERMLPEVKPFWQADRKEEYWALCNRAENLIDETVKAFNAAQGAFQEALGFERGNREARAALADLYWEEFSRAETREDRSSIVLYEGLVRQYNDGQYDSKLGGAGTLAVSTSSYPCRCLIDGRMVAPEELGGSVGRRASGVENAGKGAPVLDTEHPAPGTSRCGIMGFHPFSGRSLDGRKRAEGVPELEPREPTCFRVHGPDCRTRTLECADVWLFRFEERKRILVPVCPSDMRVEGERSGQNRQRSPDHQPFRASSIPPSVLDRLYGPGSPFRPEEGLYLGKTPIPRFGIPMGSYLLIIAGPSTAPARVPVYIGRNADESVDAVLYGDDEIAQGFAQVPSGKFVFQGDKHNPYSRARAVWETEDFFAAVFPVTCSEYREFLNNLASTDPAQAGKRVPRESENSGDYWPCVEGKYVVPTAEWLRDAPPAQRARARRLAQAPMDWEEDWPVLGISWDDAVSYSAWYSRKRGLVASLPHDVMWEKAARGVDARFYPFGNHFDDVYANTMRSHEGGMRPCPVHSFPLDEGPYGNRGLCGNSVDWCINDVDDGRRRLLRGGSWLDFGDYPRATTARGNTPGNVFELNGARLIVLPRLPTTSIRRVQ